MPDLYWVVIIGFALNLFVLAKVSNEIEKTLLRIEQRVNKILELTPIPPDRY